MGNKCFFFVKKRFTGNWTLETLSSSSPSSALKHHHYMSFSAQLPLNTKRGIVQRNPVVNTKWQRFIATALCSYLLHCHSYPIHSNCAAVFPTFSTPQCCCTALTALYCIATVFQCNEVHISLCSNPTENTKICCKSIALRL